MRNYTNARAIINEEFRDTEDLDGLFSGWQRRGPALRAVELGLRGHRGRADRRQAGADRRRVRRPGPRRARHGRLRARRAARGRTGTSSTRAASSSSSSATSRATRPRWSRRSAASRASSSSQVAEALCDNSGPERTAAICYAVGWTQHTTGVQNIRAAAIIQLLLGNIGRPGGGILALRGHANIQGSTDIPTLFDILPGYIPMPHPTRGRRFDEWVQKSGPEERRLGLAAGLLRVSLLKAWWGDAATEENDFGLRLPAAHRRRPLALRDDAADDRRRHEGLLRHRARTRPSARPTPACSARRCAASTGSSCATPARSRPRRSGTTRPRSRRARSRPRTSAPRCSSCPPPAHIEKDGTFTNTQRLLQWHYKAVEPPGDCRSELWFAYHLSARIREKLAGSTDPKDRADPRPRPGTTRCRARTTSPTPRRSCRRSTAAGPTARSSPKYQELKEDGSTTCGSWIHAGIYADGVNQTARKKPGTEQNWIAPGVGLGVAGEPPHPLQPRLGRPGRQAVVRAQALRLVGRRGRASGRRSATTRTSSPTSRPTTSRREGAKGMDAIARRRPVHPAPRRARLALRAARPRRRPAADALRAARVAVRQPALRAAREPDAPDASTAPRTRTTPRPMQPGADVFPFVLTTYRLTEHHTAGGMSRTVPYLSELQPEMFCEVSPGARRRARARARRLGDDRHDAHGDRGARDGDRAHAAADASMDRVVHQVGLPYHWGRSGLVNGRRGQRAAAAGARPQRAHLRVQGRDLRHPARPPAARAGAAASYVDDYRARGRGRERPT